MASKVERMQATAARNRAMSHPLRAGIFRVINDRTASPNEVALELSADLGDVSYHMRQLSKLGCAELVSTRPVRGATEHFYRATQRHLVDTEEWEELDTTQAEALTDEFMQVIVDDYTRSRRSRIVGSDRHFHITRTPIVVDEEGREKVLEIFEDARKRIEAEEAASAARIIDSKEEALHLSSSIACFGMPAPKPTRA